MKIEINSAQTVAFLRHVGSSVASVVAVSTIFVSLTPDQQAAIVSGVQNITDGAQKIIAGISTLIPIASGLWAMYSSSFKSNVKAIDANPNIDVVPLTSKGAQIIAEVKGNT